MVAPLEVHMKDTKLAQRRYGALVALRIYLKNKFQGNFHEIHRTR